MKSLSLALFVTATLAASFNPYPESECAFN